jgi:capsular exopolysaccharide synthesis family protein
MMSWKEKNNRNNKYEPISMIHPGSMISEQYRKIRSNIDLSHIDKKIKTIAITSSMNEEGKTTTVLNLATLYAQSGEKTLIIDLDLRRPRVHRGFSLPNINGVSDLITDDKDPKEYIKVIDDNLHVLNAGKNISFPCELLMSEKLKKLIEHLKQNYDKIFIDTPPVHLVTDASIVSSFVDGLIFVIASRLTKTEAIKQDIKTLNDNGAYIIGTVLTRVKKSDLGYYKQQYYNEYNDN